MTLNKYAVALLQLLIVTVTALQASVADGLTETEVWQLAGLVVGAFASVFVPLLERGWAGALKVGAAVGGAGIAAIVPFVTDGWTPSAAIVVVLAVLNTLATQIGVNIRVDAARASLLDTRIPNQVIVDTDPAAVGVVRSHSGTWQL